MRLKYLLPLGIFVVLVIFLAVGLKLDPREVPSPLIGKPAPDFTLPRLHQAANSLGTADLKGQVWILNVWASWCVACRAEHPVLNDLAKRIEVPLIGLNYKDQQADALAWLQRFGDPYTASVVDREGRIGIDWGVYGVPETFVMDKQGRVRYKHIGPVKPDDVTQKILPLLRQLEQEPA